MSKIKFRGMNLLAASKESGGYVAMGINQDVESQSVGDTIYAYISTNGQVLRRADAGEFLNIALKHDVVEQKVFTTIRNWEFPDWHCLAYEEKELSTLYFLYRQSPGTAIHQYGTLEVHVGPQSSGKKKIGNDRIVMHRIIQDIDIVDLDYTMECLPGYSIKTVVEALPTFSPLKYEAWISALQESKAIPFEFEQGYFTACQTMVPYPPAQYQGTAWRWHQAVEAVAGMPIGRAYSQMEVTWLSYHDMCRNVGINLKSHEEEE